MTTAAIARAALRPGARLPDFELADHAGNRRRLSDLVAGDPAVLQFFRGWWCPKEQAFLRRMLELQDDMEIAYARMISVSAGPPQDAVTALLRDASHFEGALTVARGAGVARLADDPFARIFPARALRLDAGVLGATAPPCGPTIERYGSAQPWPWDRYDAGEG